MDHIVNISQVNNMKYKDFEDYLQTKHAEQYHGLDDNMPDDYEEWLSNLSSDEWIFYAQKYADIIKKDLDNAYGISN